MTSFLDLARSRRSCRFYTDKRVPRKDLELCAEAARHAPSACNAQPWKFMIIDDPDICRKVASLFPTPGIAMNAFARNSPAFIVILSEKQKVVPWFGGKLVSKDFRLMDLGIACAHIVLQAEELGIGTCILGWFDERKLKKILGVPRAKRIELVITMGYAPANTPAREKRLKDRNETISFNHY